MADAETLIQSVIDLLDVLVDLYLGSLVKPFLRFHDEFSSDMNKLLRSILDDNKDIIPDWLTGNASAYLRVFLVFPTILFLAWGQLVIPFLFVVMVDLLGLLGFVVAKFWVDAKRDHAEDVVREDDRPTSKSFTSSDDDSMDSYEFEVVTTGSPQRMKSWSLTHRYRSCAGFLDAACDKAFIIPCWIYLLSTVPSGQYRTIKYVSLFWLIVTELANGCLQFKTFYAGSGVPQVEGDVFPLSSISREKFSALKRSFEMLGTGLFILPYFRFLGVTLLLLACPLAYESFRRKTKKRVVYVVCTQSEKFDYKIIKFWSQAKALGTRLVVGVVGKGQTDMVCNACATACVDEVIAEAPAKADLMFLERQRIDYVVFMSSQTSLVTDEVVAMGACLVLGDDHVVRPMKPKVDSKKL